MQPRVTIAQAIREVREQLIEAATEGQNDPIQFLPKAVELELAITFSVEAEAGGGFKLFSLVDLSGKAKTENESTHKVKLTLEPRNSTGEPLLIRSKQRESD